MPNDRAGWFEVGPFGPRQFGVPGSRAARYREAVAVLGDCPIESGFGKLADNECSHGRLPGDRTAPCGCWPQEGPVPRRARGRRKGL